LLLAFEVSTAMLFVVGLETSDSDMRCHSSFLRDCSRRLACRTRQDAFRHPDDETGLF